MSCVICKEFLHVRETVLVKRRGLETLVKCSLLRKDGLEEVFRSAETIGLHKDCRQKYLIKPKLSKPCPNEPASFVFAPVLADDTKTGYIPEDTEEHGAVDALNIDSDILVKSGLADLKDIDENPGLELLAGTELPDKIEFVNDSETNRDTFELKYSPKTTEELTTSSPENNVTNERSTSKLDSFHECASMTDPESVQNLNDIGPSKKSFPFKHLCFFCAEDASDEFVAAQRKYTPRKSLHSRIRYSARIAKITSRNTQDKIMKTLSMNVRNNPCSTDHQVIQRIQDIDMVKMNARYHIKCYDNVKRHTLSQKEDTIEVIRRYMENENRRHFTGIELFNLVKSSLSTPTMRIKSFTKILQHKLHGQIHISKPNGKQPIVTVLKDFDSNILNNGQDLFKSGGVVLGSIGKKKKGLAKKKKNKEKEIDAVTTEHDSEVFDDDPTHSPCEDNVDIQDYIQDSVEFCNVCLSADRQLEELGRYGDIYKRICGDVNPVMMDSNFLLCWECRALLKNVQKFQNRVNMSQRYLNGEMQRKSLSTMCITTLPRSLVSCEPDKPEIDFELEGKYTEETGYVDLEQIPYESDIEEGMSSHLENDTAEGLNFDYDYENPPAAEQDSKSAPEREAQENDDDVQAFDNDEDPPVLPPAKRRKRAVVKKKLKVKKYLDDEVDETLANKKTMDNLDSDWEMEIPKSSKKIKQKKVKNKTVRHKEKEPREDLSQYCHVENIKNFNKESKIRRVRIQPDEMSDWRERERSSEYIKKGNPYTQCKTCICRTNDNHFDVFHSEDNPFVCPICEVSCPTQLELDSHLADHYLLHECAICGYKCCNFNNIKYHLEKHRREYQCLVCGMKFGSSESFEDHFKDSHLNSVCDFCGKRFLLKAEVEAHIQRYHVTTSAAETRDAVHSGTENAATTCTICNANFKRVTGLRKHIKMNHSISQTEAAYCVQCDKQFDNERQLRKHVYISRKHISEWKRPLPKPTPKQKFSCPECAKVYSKRIYLRNHIDSVHGNKQEFHECSECGKGFVWKSSLRIHVKTQHKGYKAPKNKMCGVCGRGFSSNTILTHHMRTHTGERPHACAHCGARFAQRYAMLSHVKHVHERIPRNSAV